MFKMPKSLHYARLPEEMKNRSVPLLTGQIVIYISVVPVVSLRQMVQCGVNTCFHTRHLVTRASSNSSTMDIVTINGLNCLVYVFQYNSTCDKFNGTIKQENRSLSSFWSPFPSSRSKIPTNVGVLVLTMLCNKLVSLLSWWRLGLAWK